MASAVVAAVSAADRSAAEDSGLYNTSAIAIESRLTASSSRSVAQHRPKGAVLTLIDRANRVNEFGKIFAVAGSLIQRLQAGIGRCFRKHDPTR